MPKATLLGNVGATYYYSTSKRTFEFVVGVPLDVPVVVALTLGKKQRHGKSLFRIEDMPEIIKPATPEQNVDSAQLYQPRLIEPWPLELH